jgi:hypothetical protein
MTVEADVAGIDFQKAAKHQLCVPSVEMNVESYRRRGALQRKQSVTPKAAGKTKELIPS